MKDAAQEFAYEKLMAAIDGIIAGKGLSDHIVYDYGRLFEIGKVLMDARDLDGEFSASHIDTVKAVFAKLGRPYPGNKIGDCVAVLASALIR
jgi:hypothetical protein